jgi:hypothetical protein
MMLCGAKTFWLVGWFDWGCLIARWEVREEWMDGMDGIGGIRQDGLRDRFMGAGRDDVVSKSLKLAVMA